MAKYSVDKMRNLLVLENRILHSTSPDYKQPRIILYYSVTAEQQKHQQRTDTLIRQQTSQSELIDHKRRGVVHSLVSAKERRTEGCGG